VHRQILFSIACLTFIGTTTGCVTGTRSVAMSEPNFSMTRTISNEPLAIREITDDRVFEDGSPNASTPSVRGGLDGSTSEQRARLIGRQRNGYGMAMGDIDLPNERTVRDEVRDLVSRGVSERGYALSDSSATRMDIEIQKFWAWMQPGVWSVSFNSEIRTKLRIGTSEGTKEITVEGRGENKGQGASDANWALAFQRAYDDYLKNLESALAELGL
jgi:hypothetical protein